VVVTTFTTIPAFAQSQRQWPTSEYVFRDALVIKPNTSETPQGYAVGGRLFTIKATPKLELPVLTHGGHAEFLSAELDYEEMVALAGICRLTALYDPHWTPEQRTEWMCFSADFEQLAEWAGKGWRASNPSGAAPACMFLARRARNRRSVIKLEHAKHWLARG
jgi:hypothetical protein